MADEWKCERRLIKNHLGARGGKGRKEAASDSGYKIGHVVSAEEECRDVQEYSVVFNKSGMFNVKQNETLIFLTPALGHA